MLAPPQRCRNWAPVQSPCSPIAARPAAAGLITIGSTIDLDLHKLGIRGICGPYNYREISPLFRGTASPRAVSQISLLFCFEHAGEGEKNNPTGFWTSFSQKCRCKSTMFWQTELWPLWSDPLRKSKVFHSVGYIFNLWNIYTYIYMISNCWYIWYMNGDIDGNIYIYIIYVLIWKIYAESTPPSRSDPRDNRRESSPGKIPDRVFESSAAEVQLGCSICSMDNITKVTKNFHPFSMMLREYVEHNST